MSLVHFFCLDDHEWQQATDVLRSWPWYLLYCWMFFRLEEASATPSMLALLCFKPWILACTAASYIEMKLSLTSLSQPEWDNYCSFGLPICLLSASQCHDWVCSLLSELWQKTPGTSFCIIGSLKLWTDYFMQIYTHHQGLILSMGVLAICSCYSCYSHEVIGLDGVIRKCIVSYAVNIFVLFPFSGRKIGCSEQRNLFKSFM
jgi:hypothetical protein